MLTDSPSRTTEVDAVVIGGGFFGCYLALLLAGRGRRAVVFEREAELMTRASYGNQARVHNGYHYPRSILTAIRSRLNFGRFVDEFRPAIVDTFDKYYAIAHPAGKVTASQFRIFCERIGAPVSPAPQAVRKMFNFDLIEDVFSTVEYAFDSLKLRDLTAERLALAGVDIRLSHEALRVAPSNRGVEVVVRGPDGDRQFSAKHVFNCTYTNINHVLSASDRQLIPLKHEIAEIALVEVPEPVRNMGVTVMCGPYFSVMPFPPRGLHSFSHVRYTPHSWWEERDDRRFDRLLLVSDFEHVSKFDQMVRDARRYWPIIGESTYVDSIYELKTVLPQTEGSDARPILFKRDEAMPGFVSVMGGKVDNVYDLDQELERLYTDAP